MSALKRFIVRYKCVYGPIEIPVQSCRQLATPRPSLNNRKRLLDNDQIKRLSAQNWLKIQIGIREDGMHEDDIIVLMRSNMKSLIVYIRV